MISPPGTSATVQGLVAGMDDGLGFSIGALFGGFLYQKIGGTQSFRVFATIALLTCIAHFILRPAKTHEFRVAPSPATEITDQKHKETLNNVPAEEIKLTSE